MVTQKNASLFYFLLIVVIDELIQSIQELGKLYSI